MKNNQTPSFATFSDTRTHYQTLDGLRRVAALLVVVYHIYEGLAFASGNPIISTFNHGYLSVDFFFLLSGYVIGYAYDERLKTNMTTAQFIRRRLIRLHPMIVAGSLIGAAAYLLQGSVKWDGTHVTLPWVGIAFLCSILLLPIFPGNAADVRGNGEMYPLNGPAWSLFFEYIGNLLYVFFIRRCSTPGLSIIVLLSGGALAYFSLFYISGYGMLGVGWTLDPINFLGGMLRMLFPYTLGMLLARFKLHSTQLPMLLLGSIVLTAVVATPFIDTHKLISYNALFEMACIMFLFPCIVYFSAAHTPNISTQKICIFLGNLSYPLYAVHYPVMYLLYHYMIQQKAYTIQAVWPQALCAIGISILLAWLLFRFYDLPLRRFLAKRYR